MPAYHRSPHFYVFTDVAVTPDDAALDEGPIVHDGVIPDHGRPLDGDAAFDFDFVAQVDGTVKAGVGGYLHIPAHPDVAVQPLPRLLEPDLALQEVESGPHVFLDVAHVAPVTRYHITVHRLPVGKQHREQVLAEVEGLALLEELQRPGLDDVDAGVHLVGYHLTPAGFLQELGDAPFFVGDDHAVFQGVGHFVEGDGDQGSFGFVEFDEAGEVNIGHGIAAYHDEGFVEEVLGVFDAARRAKRHVFNEVVQVHPQGTAVAEVVLDDVGHILQGDGHVGKSMLPQEVQDVGHHGFVDHRDHRLGPGHRQGPEP